MRHTASALSHQCRLQKTVIRQVQWLTYVSRFRGGRGWGADDAKLRTPLRSDAPSSRQRS